MKNRGAVVVFIIILTLSAFPAGLVSPVGTTQNLSAGSGRTLISIDTGKFPDAVVVSISTPNITGIFPSNVTVYEDGKQQKLLFVNSTIQKDFRPKGDPKFTKPLDVVFIVDISNSMYDDLDVIKKELVNFVKDTSKENVSVRFAVVTFGNRTNDARVLLNLTSDIRKVTDAVDSIKYETWGQESSFYAINTAFNLNLSAKRNKVFVLMTDEDDQGSVPLSAVRDNIVGNNVALVMIYNQPMSPRLNELAKETGAITFDILSLRYTHTDFASSLLREISSVFQYPRIVVAYKPTNDKMDGSTRHVRIVFAINNGTSIAFETTYTAPDEKYQEYRKAIPTREKVYAVLKEVLDWAKENEGYIRSQNPPSLKSIYLNRDYIPVYPIDLPGNIKTFKDDLINYLKKIQRLKPAKISASDLDMVMRFLESNVKHSMSIRDITITRNGNIYNVNSPGGRLAITIWRGDKKADRSVNVFGTSHTIRTQVTAGFMAIAYPIDVIKSQPGPDLGITLLYIEVGAYGRVDNGDEHTIFFESVTAPITQIYNIPVERGSIEKIEPHFKVPLWDSSFGGGVSISGDLSAKIRKKGFSIGVEGNLISLSATVSEFLKKWLNSIEFTPSVEIIVEGSGKEASLSFGMSVPIKDLSVEHGKIFVTYLLYRSVEGLKKSLGNEEPHNWIENLLRKVEKKVLSYMLDKTYAYMVNTIESMDYETRKDTFLSVEEYNSEDTVNKYIREFMHTPLGSRVPEFLANSIKFKEATAVNLLPFDDPGHEFSIYYGLESDLEKELFSLPIIEYGPEISVDGKEIVDIGLHVKAKASLKFDTPLLAVEITDPPVIRENKTTCNVTFLGGTPIDRDNNGLFDGLGLDFSLSFSKRGTYTVYSYLSNSSDIVALNKTTVQGDSEPLTIHPVIPSQYIYGAGSPLDVGIMVIDSNGRIVYKNSSLGYVDVPGASKLEHVTPNFTLTYNPFDSNSNGYYDGIKVTLRNRENLDLVMIPVLSRDNVIVTMDPILLNGKQSKTLTIDGMHVRKLSNNFTLSFIVSTKDGIYLGDYAFDIKVKGQFESDYPTVRYVYPLSVDYKPALNVEVNVPRDGFKQLQVQVAYSVGNVTRTAYGQLNGSIQMGNYNITIPLDPSDFIEYASSEAVIRGVSLITDGLTTDRRHLNRSLHFDILPDARIREIHAVFNREEPVLNITTGILSYISTNSTVVVLFTLGNITRSEFLHPPLSKGVTTVVPVTFNFSKSEIRAGGTGRVSVFVYGSCNTLIARGQTTVSIPSAEEGTKGGTYTKPNMNNTAISPSLLKETAKKLFSGNEITKLLVLIAIAGFVLLLVAMLKKLKK